MRIPRFMVPLLTQEGTIELSQSEAHHLIRVLRLKQDDPIEVIDGQGGYARARVQEIRGKTVTVRAYGIERQARRTQSLEIALPWPKGNRSDWLLEKLGELGIDAIIPLVTSRGIRRSPKSERVDRLMVSVMKQSGRLFPLIVREPKSILELLNQNKGYEFWIASLGPQAKALEVFASEKGMRISEGISQGVIGICGPEGGLSEDEEEIFIAAGARPLRLASTVLRSETAALALASSMVGLTFEPPIAQDPP